MNITIAYCLLIIAWHAYQAMGPGGNGAWGGHRFGPPPPQPWGPGKAEEGGEGKKSQIRENQQNRDSTAVYHVSSFLPKSENDPMVNMHILV